MQKLGLLKLEEVIILEAEFAGVASNRLRNTVHVLAWVSDCQVPYFLQDSIGRQSSQMECRHDHYLCPLPSHPAVY